LIVFFVSKLDQQGESFKSTGPWKEVLGLHGDI